MQQHGPESVQVRKPGGQSRGQGCSKEGRTSPEESLRPQADESCYEEEAVGDDEGTVGGEEEGVERTDLLVAPRETGRILGAESTVQ